MFLDFYNNLSDNGKLIIIESGRPLRDQIKEVDWSQYVILANGRKVSPDYTPADDDFLMMRRIPGSTAVIAWVAIISAVVAGIASGVSIYKAKMQQKKLREMQEAMSARDDVSNIPWLQGASNAIATGKSQPYIVGRHLFTPYLLQQSFYKISGTDGINQDVYITLEGGFGPQAIRQIKADDVMLYDFGNQTTPQRGSAYRPPSGLFKYFSGINDNFIQIEQNRALGSSGSTISSDFYIKHAVEEPNVMLPWREDCEQWQATKTEEYTERVWIGDEDHGWYRNVKRTRTVTYTDGEIKTETKKFTLDPCAKNVEICIMFNGLCKYSDSGKKQSHTRNIGFRYSTNGGSSWSPLDVGGGSTSGGYYVVSWTKSSTSQLRYVKSHTFTWAQGKAALTSGVPIMIEVTNRDKKSTAKGGAYEDAYVQWVQSEIFDAEKSKAANSFVNCKVLEDKEAAYSTIIALKLRASSENEGKLGKINVITSGAARTWNGAAWSSSKSATSNPASWLLEVLTSSIHPASQYADSEIDLTSFGALYEFCQTNGFSVDYVITQGQKKSQILEAICNVCRCMLYRNIYGKIAVAIDKEKENAVALLNAQNILGVEITKSFARRTDGIKLSWVDASSGYSQAETICMRPGVTRTADSIIREMDVQGITGYDHLMKYARYIMASETLRPKTVRVRTGAEGVYYTPYSKILMQDDSLRVGLGNATIRSVVTSGGNIVGLKLNEYIDLDNEHDFGVIINCVSDDYCSQLAKQITAPQGHARVDEILFETPFSVDSSVIPHAGDVLSYGYLGEGGEFDSISSPYIITGIEPGDNEVTLNLLDYNPDVYTTGDYGEYVPNITRKTEPYTPVIIPPPETSADVEDILSGDNMEAPDIPTGITVVATRDGLRVACNKPDTSSIKNTIAKIVWELALDGIGPEDRQDDPHWTEYSTLGYEYLIPFPVSVPYPEASDMYNWLVRCKFVSVYGKTSDYGEYKTVNTDSYGTWLVQAPTITERTNKRSLHLHMEQPSGNRQLYGNVRYQVQIRRYDDLDNGSPVWYKPDLSASANPYGNNESCYKVDTTPAPDPAYVVATSDFSQTVPLQGQSQTPANPNDTVYYFRVLAFNEAGVALDNGSPAYVITNQMTARATGARDVVLAHLNDGTQHPDALTAKNIYAENLTAIVGTFSQMQGDVETSDNFWKGMDTDNPEFRVGNSHVLEEQDDEDAEYIHYKNGSLAMKLKNFIVTVAETTIKGTLTLYNAAKDFRNLVSSAGMRFQKKVTDWLSPVDVAQVSADADSNLTITNNPSALAGYQIAPPSNTIKVHHLDTNLNDTSGNNTESLVAVSGGCGATAEPILDRLTAYFQGKLKKADVVTKSAASYSAAKRTISGFTILGMVDGVAAGYTVSGSTYTCKTIDIETGGELTSFDVTFSSNMSLVKIKAFYGDDEFYFGIAYSAVVAGTTSYYCIFYHQDAEEIAGAHQYNSPILDIGGFISDSPITGGRKVYNVFSVGKAGNSTIYITGSSRYGYGSFNYSYQLPNSATIKSLIIVGKWVIIDASNTTVYGVTYNKDKEYNFSYVGSISFVSYWNNYNDAFGRYLFAYTSGTYNGERVCFSVDDDDIIGGTDINTTTYTPIPQSPRTPNEYIYKTADSSFYVYNVQSQTYAQLGVYGAAPAMFDNEMKYYSSGNTIYFFPGYNQSLVAEKHYAFWFKGSSIKFGRVTIPTISQNGVADWLYCRLTASGSTVSWYIVRKTLASGDLDVFADSSASLSTYSLEDDNINNLDFILDGAVEEFTADASDISPAVMKKMIQYKLPYGAPGTAENLPGSDKFYFLAKYPDKVISNVIGGTQVIPAGGAVTLNPGANAGQRLIFTALGSVASPCTIQYTALNGNTVTDTIKTVADLTYTWTGAAWYCSSAPSPGRILEQKPDEPTPAELFGGQWVEHNYGGVFFRSKGGDSCGFHAAYKVASWASGSSVTLAENAVDGNGTTISANNYILVAVYPNGASYYRKITAVSSRTLTLESALPSGYANLTEVLIGESEGFAHTHGRGTLRIYGSGGLRVPFDYTSAQNTIGPLYSAIDGKYGGMNGGSSHGWGAIYFDTNRSGTTWTGATSKPNIGADKSHIVPNTVVLCYWKRRQ